jgi:excisionase family DNA binding protein
MHTIPNDDNDKRFLTPAALAQRWRWHPESIRRWTRLGKLPIVKIGRRTLIPVSAVEALEADGQIGVKNG